MLLIVWTIELRKHARNVGPKGQDEPTSMAGLAFTLGRYACQVHMVVLSTPGGIDRCCSLGSRLIGCAKPPDRHSSCYTSE